MAKINLYSTGGCGVNIGQRLEKYSKSESGAFADIVPYMIDTSRSNMIGQADNTYLVDGLDGSGKKRDSNYKAINDSCKQILMNFKPAAVNVVLHSCSGGSGSVIGPVLVSELLDRGELTIVIAVGSSASLIETQNTVNTLKSYENISSKRETPVICCYFENSPAMARGEVDREIISTVVLLATMFSGNNRGLDTEDLRNFIKYDRVTSYKPRLALLEFQSGKISLGKGLSLVSLLSLSDDSTSTDVEIPVEYQATGIFSMEHAEETRRIIETEVPVHACVVTGFFNQVVERLDVKIANFSEARSAVKEKSIVDHSHDATEDGLIL